ncbi:MAG: DUF4410 domain-containing protein [Verrucomicrobiota bacterium]
MVLLIGGCASVSVKDEQQVANAGGETRPDAIYVIPFSTDGEFNVDREGAELAEFKQNLQEMMVVALETRFPKHLVPTRTAPSMMDVPSGNYWVVGGTFTLVNQGSRALRATIGFGAGGTKVETDVYVYDIASKSPTPFRVFRTTGGSGAQPGAVVGLNPVGAALSAVSGAAKGLTDDVVRTSRMITADLSEYMYERNWIPESRKLEAKR